MCTVSLWVPCIGYGIVKEWLGNSELTMNSNILQYRMHLQSILSLACITSEYCGYDPLQ